MTDEKQLRELLPDSHFRKILGDELYTAVCRGDCSVRRPSLSDAESHTALVLLAASRGHTALLRTLGRDAVAVAHDPGGRGALHYAARRGRSETVTCLLQELQQMPHADAEGHSVLQYACAGGEVRVVTQLLPGKDQTDGRNSRGTPSPARRLSDRDVADITAGLIRAARRGHVRVVLSLLREHGGELRRPLHHGLGAGRNSLLHLLGRSVTARDLAELHRYGLNLDLTAANVKGVTPLRQIPPPVIKSFLDMGVTPAPELTGASVTEAFRVSNPFSKNSDLDLATMLELARSPRHEHLVFHPLFACVCAIKWRHVRPWYYGLLVVLFLAAIASSAVVVFRVQTAYLRDNPATIKAQMTHHRPDIITWQAVLIGVLVLLLGLEILSFAVHRIWINVLRYCAWAVSFGLVITLLTFPVAFIQGTAFFTILVPWSACMKNTGHHHMLAQYYSNFIEIAKTCLKIMAVFGSLVLGFVLSFHVMMLGSSSQHIFQQLHTSGIKMAAMMVGDLTVDEFEERFSDLQWAAAQALFTLVVTVVLYNMMNALAVSDTSLLRRKATLYQAVSLARQLLFFQVLLRRLPLRVVPRVPGVAEVAVSCAHYRWRVHQFLAHDGEHPPHPEQPEDTTLDLADQRFSKSHLRVRRASFDLNLEVAETIQETAALHMQDTAL